MKKYFKIAVLYLAFTQIYAQKANLSYELLNPSKHWILVNNKIEKDEILLTSYKISKLKANTFVMSFGEKGEIVYNYETNYSFKLGTNLQFLDIVADESFWEFNPITNQITLTIKGGYSSLEDFRFKRNYKIERLPDGFILRKVAEEFFEDLKQNQFIQTNIVENLLTKEPNTPSMAIDLPTPSSPAFVETQIVPIAVIDYAARSRDLLDKSKRWMLMKNKIERNDILLETYDESKLTINNLIMSFDTEGKIAYDYESDPKVSVCAGVDFLDIDTDETSWEYNAEKNIVTLTLKGGYASLDDFKFKRDYWVETIEGGYILRKLREYYFNDFRKRVKKKSK
jgi:hypothetical protein